MVANDLMTKASAVLLFSRVIYSKKSEGTTCTMEFVVIHAHFSDDTDYLDSPSARLVTGQTIRSGTGFFDLVLSPDYMIKGSVA
jgi:hypothetical protein